MVTGNASPIDVLKKARTIVVVGASNNPEKEAYTVPRYLREHGYKIIPVNPTATEIQGEKSYLSLQELPEAVARNVDVVEVFRPSEELPKVALQAVELRKRYGRQFVFWAQQGLESDEAKRILEESGIQYVMDACMRALHKTYFR